MTQRSELGQPVEAEQGFLPEDVYKLVTASIPIVCVDLIPVDTANPRTPRIGIIERATGSQKGLPAIPGGRIEKGESIAKAIQRHLWTDLGLQEFDLHDANTLVRPFSVDSYAHAQSGPGLS
jgi:hypothetical protein